MRYFLVVFLLLGSGLLKAQVTVSGIIQAKNTEPIVGCNILVLSDSSGTTTDIDGKFTLVFSKNGKYRIRVSHVQYETKIITIDATSETGSPIEIFLDERPEMLEEVNVTGSDSQIDAVNSVSIGAESLRLAPIPFQEITNILATLPSVVSNNELSSAYSVRGGSYDENLVLVNGIPVYRPFLVRSGQEEGLSFINANLISAVNFSAGGWSVKYDDKMSSVLSASYREPSKLAGSAMISLLGAEAHVEGTVTEKFTYLLGVRHKQSAYLLNTLDVQGDYQPRFTDIQALLKGQLSDNTSLELLIAHANNMYSVVPTQSTTSFGTFNKELRLQVAFEGQQQMKYQTYQAALKLKHSFSQKINWVNMASISRYGELENIDLEGGYRLCDVDKNLSSDTFNECITTRGIGTLYNYARNRLDATLFDAESSLSYAVNASNNINLGIGYSKQLFDDKINEYELIDSAGYVTVESSILAQNNTDANLIKAFALHTIDMSSWSLSYGIRANYNTLNKYLLVSPRVLISHQPVRADRIKLNFGVGLYGQQPFYKEFRTVDGTIKTDIKGQSGLHFNFGLDYDILWWGRPFKLTTEVYYKKLWNQIPYIIENVRQQYYPNYMANARSAGFEARLGGEFIPGTESWFSFGIMSAKEQIPGVDAEFIRRPTDQRFKVAFVFEDHIPGDPSLRVNLELQYGSGLPISPPNSLEDRNSFQGDDYSRVDIGFSKIVTFNEKFFKYLRLGVEINNLLATRNAVSYTWIKDVNSQQFAVPNYLTGRLFNVVISTEF